MAPNTREPRDVAQPPPAVTYKSPSAVHPIPVAKPSKGFSKRNLPHLQTEEKTYFVTFATHRRWRLPESAREIIIGHCLHDHKTKFQVHGLVVMPDHVHMVFTPLRDRTGAAFGLSEIMNGIKGGSAHSINRLLKRKGHVWQDESFDHILRSEEKIIEKVDYICQNPVRERNTAEGGCATRRQEKIS